MDKPIIDKRISQRADEFAQKEYMYDSYERDALSKGYYWGYKDAEKGLAMSSPLPEDTVLFQKGVEEGRRLERDDLALTWEDIAKIDAIILDVNNEFAVDYSKEINRQKFYEEVLKRFKETKDGQVHKAEAE